MNIVSADGRFENPSQVQRWAQSFRPASIEGNETSLQMRLERLPPEWESLLSAFTVNRVELGHDPGRSRLHVDADPEAIAELQRADSEGRPFILEEFAPIRRPRLTARQRYLLHSALDWGYYDVPRKITLEKMATKFGIGLNTLSVVLRNAEAALVRNFVLFDEKPLDPAKRRVAGSNNGDG